MSVKAHPARVALLLHMHQPDYRDPATGRPGMPWVRLHAARGYTDVAALALERGARLTVNVVPSLLEQLQHYADGGTDRWEDLSRVPAEELRPSEISFVRARFVHGNPAMRGASGRYRELEARAAELSHPQDLRDLQVWSNLAWLGFTGRKDPLARELIAQERGFSHEQLLALMDLQRRLVCGVLDLWRRLPSVSCSPLCHPILPLLVDLEHARRCLPHLPEDLGARFRWPDDARRQLTEGRARTAELLGIAPPRGLWPSEGSLSPEVVALAGECGFEWIASDEGLLHRSKRDRPAALHRPWSLGEGLPVVFFRSRELSDRVGFHYHHVPGWRAAADLVDGADHLLAQTGDQGAIPVILDGENPWEAYPDAGEGFLGALFDSGRLVTMDEATRLRPAGRIHQLHTGSWVNADLHIWAGDEEDRLAWRHLGELRQAWENAGRPEAAWPSLAAAEGSDWFWWYGPDFHTPFADFFDHLFRAHLAAAWRAMGLTPPSALDVPIDTRPVAARRLRLAGGVMAYGLAPVRGATLGVGAGGELLVRLDLPHPRPPLGAGVASFELEVDGLARLSWPWSFAEGEMWSEPCPARAPQGAEDTRQEGPAPARTNAWIAAGPSWFEVEIGGASSMSNLRLRMAIREGERVLWAYPDTGWAELGALSGGGAPPGA